MLEQSLLELVVILERRKEVSCIKGPQMVPASILGYLEAGRPGNPLVDKLSKRETFPAVRKSAIESGSFGPSLGADIPPFFGEHFDFDPVRSNF